MILRGTVLSEKRIPLDSAHPGRVTPGTATVVDLVPPVTRPPLSLDSVLEWLENQDRATYTALAAHLASDLDEVRLIAEREGFASGAARGLEDAQAKTQAAVELLARVSAQTQLTLTQESQQLAAQCVDIVMEVLGKIAGPTLCGRDAIVPVVLQAVGRLKDEREIVIRVSERDLPALSEARATLAVALSGRKFLMVADSRVEFGGCIVESRLGSLDARLETQLRVAFEALEAARSSSQGEVATT